ncbi:uncharacterized protein LOC117615858 [Prunus dulcis]|uniref:uncharacterized protein LOC117615858 n=1 Tax=Prunus dulcis TaxID=3755 RepID=UPI00148219B8|nr:uncharacterized protein LOC117615858 [Prunus dulcis]
MARQGKDKSAVTIKGKAKAMTSRQAPIFSSPIGPESVSVPIVEVAEEGGEVPSAEVADEQLLQEGKQQHEDPQVEGCGMANVADPNSEQAEAVFALVLEETLPEETLPEEAVPPSEPVCTNEGYHYPAPKADAMPMNEDDAPQSQEAEPKTPVPNPASEPSAGLVDEKGSGTSRSKSFDSAFISKAMTKMLLEQWLALSLEEKVAEEQSVRVFEALDSLHRAHLDFAASFESAKAYLGALVNKFKYSDSSSQNRKTYQN